MSITVNYKGEDIAQSAGDALTLLTAGKYMEADVILSASGGGEQWQKIGTVSGDMEAHNRGLIRLDFVPNKMYKLTVQNADSAPSNVIKSVLLYTTESEASKQALYIKGDASSAAAITVSNDVIAFVGSGSQWQFPNTQAWDVYTTDLNNILGV